MIPVRITIENFGPFRATARRRHFDFPSQPGLYFLWGENRADPQMEGNACGKSKLWEALCWVLFDRTSDGVKGPAMMNWDADAKEGAKVEFVYLDDAGVPKQVTRTWRPNSWTMTVDNKEFDLAKDSNPLLADLKVGYEPFMHSVLFAQSREFFMDMRPEPQAQLFGEIMAIDRWVEYSQRASQRAGRTDLALRTLERDLGRVSGRLEQLSADTALEDLSAQYEQARKNRLRTLQEDHDKGIALSKEKKAILARSDASEREAREAYSAELAKLEKVKGSLRELDAAISSTEVEARTLERQAKDLASALHRHGVGQSCPTCGQPIPKSSEAAMQQQLVDLEAALRKKRGLLKTAREHKAQGQESYDRQDVVVRRRNEALRCAEQATIEARRDHLQVENLLDRIEREHEECADKANPYEERAQERSRDLVDLQKQADKMQRQIDDLNMTMTIEAGWSRWFREIRLALISEALEQFELEVNNAIQSKGLLGWELEFAVDKETKAGAARRGFSVMVKSPNSPERVPWALWSGGEKQRLRVAGQEGLANLIRARTGLSLNLEVWDEPTQWLSKKGVNDLLESLARRAQVEQRQIWIVDHRSLEFGGFSGSACVIKTRNNGAYFDQSGLYISASTTRPLRRRLHE